MIDKKMTRSPHHLLFELHSIPPSEHKPGIIKET